MVFLNSRRVSVGTISRFEKLEIWQLARAQANELWQVYSTNAFSKDFELKNQLAVRSVMDNIAEGFERSGNKEFINFLLIAKASNGEVRSQLYRAADRMHINPEQLKELLSKTESLSKRITSFIKYLKSSEQKGFRYS